MTTASCDSIFQGSFTASSSYVKNALSSKLTIGIHTQIRYYYQPSLKIYSSR